MDRPTTSKWALIARLAGVGWLVALMVAGGAFGGYYLDRWLGTGPALTITGTLVGVGVSAAATYRMLAAVARAPDGSPDESGRA